MNLHTKIKLLVILFLTLLAFPKLVSAQIPPPTVSCSDTDNPEFNSLRPYQASPCNPNMSQTAGYCGNRLVITDQVGASSPLSPRTAPNCEPLGNNNYRCSYRVHKVTSFLVSLNDVTLPILGNTEDVANSQTSAETIDDAVKTNEYVSWYLNGVIGRAEYPSISMDKEQDVRKLVDFSGPLLKLLPQEKLNDYRANTVKQAVRSKTQNAGIRHDQIIGCTYEIAGLGKIPGPCYEGGLKSLISVERRLSEWQSHLPPRASDYNDYLEWWADYERWRGKFCFTPTVPSWVPVIGGQTILFCGENPFSPNYYAALFNNIPLSSTEDRKGSVSVGTTAVSSTPDVELTNVVFSGVTPATLYFAHTEEVAELANILQYTFVPKGVPQTGATSFVAPSESCDLTNIRTNEGDDLFAGQLSGTVNYDAEFTCDYGPSVSSQSCQKNINVGLGVATNTPKAEEIWQRLVAGPASVFKRMFPLLGENGSFGGILDIPAASKVTYTGSNLASSSNPGGRAGRPTELYFAHVGSVSEYFLKGIQTMLRPKGFGEPIIWGASGSISSCGEGFKKFNPPDSTTAKAKEYFDLYIRPNLTDDLMEVYAEAEAKTGVPCEVLAGVHFEEGDNNPNKSLQNGGPLNGRALLDSAIQAGNEIKAKVGGKLDDLDSIITALSRYNGGGNSNCGREPRYRGPCPPPEGFDDPYATSWIDSGHESLYLIYCWDYTQCPQPYPDFQRPGSLTVAIELFNSSK